MRRRIILAVIGGAVIALGGVRETGLWPVSPGWTLENRLVSIAAALSPNDAAQPAAAQPQTGCSLPQEQKAIRFAVIRDSGTGKN